MPRPTSRSSRRTASRATRSRSGQYVLVEDDELDEVALESTHTIDIESFVPRDEVDEIYLDEYYYHRAERQGRLRGVRRDPRGDEEGRPGRHRARGAVSARAHPDAGSRAARASWRRRCATSTEVRDEEDYFDDIPNVKVPADMLDLAVHILKTQEGALRSGQVRGSLRGRAGRADQGQARRQADRRSSPTPKPSNVINLMDALQAQREGRARRRARAPRAPQRRRAGKRAHSARSAPPQIERVKRAS